MKRASLMMLIAASVLVQGCGKLGFPSGHGFAIRPNVSAMSLTKGETTTTESLTAFKMIAVTDKYIDHTISDNTYQTPTNGIYFTSIVKKSGTGASASWSTYDSSGSSAQEYYWINDNPIVFWSWAPFDSNVKGTLSVDDTPTIPTSTSSGHDKLSFTYTMPTTVTTTSKTDADNQQDLVFAGNVEKRTFQDGTDNITAATSNGSTHANDNKFDIKFYHALSKIIFGVNVEDNTFHKSLKIKNIELIDVYSSGTCTFTIPSTFYWDPSLLSTKKTYSQDYGADFSSCTGETGAPTGWPYNSSNGLNVCSNAFFLIPQSTSGISVKITFDFEGTTIYKTVALPTTDTWAANKYYLYKIKATGSADGVSLALTLADWAERGYSILL